MISLGGDRMDNDRKWSKWSKWSKIERPGVQRGGQEANNFKHTNNYNNLFLIYIIYTNL